MKMRKLVSLPIFATCLVALNGCDKKDDFVISASTENLSVKIGEEASVSFTHETVDGQLASFKLENNSIVSIFKQDKKCTLYGKEEGNTKLTYTYNSKSVEVAVSVLPKDPVPTVSLKNFKSDTITIENNVEVDFAGEFFLDGVKCEDATFTYALVEGQNATLNGSLFKATENGSYKVSVFPKYKGVNYNKLSKLLDITVVDAYQNMTDVSYRYIGRTVTRGGQVQFDAVDSGVEFAFFGDSVSIPVTCASLNIGEVGRVKLIVDGGIEGKTISLNGAQSGTLIGSGYGQGMHIARVMNIYEEGFIPVVDPTQIVAEKYGPLNKDKKSMLVIGDSITTGYQAVSSEGAWSSANSDSTYSYAYQTAIQLDYDIDAVASQGIGLRYGYRDNNISSDQYMLNLYNKNSIYDLGTTYVNGSHDLVVLNIGTNDAAFKSKFTQEGKTFAAYYKELLELVIADNPNAPIFALFGMMSTDNDIRSGIMTAVNEELAIHTDAKIYTMFDFTSTVIHPLKAQHTKHADKLVEFIKTKIN